MSLRPDEILVGHVYRGGDPMCLPRKVNSIERDARGAKVIRVHFGIDIYTNGYFNRIDQLTLKQFCKWAVADITQEDKANG